jgi:Zn-dependent metalloprotease
MKKHLFPLLLFCFTSVAFAQAPIQNTNRVVLLNQNEASIILNKGDVLNQSTDALGFRHQSIQQQAQTIPIEGAILKLIEAPNGSKKMAGMRIDLNVQKPSNIYPFEEAVSNAMQSIETEYFYWENEHQEALIKHIEQDENATFYPSKNLFWFDSTYSGMSDRYQLAYKIELYYHGEVDHKTIFVSATNGEILQTLESCNHSAVEGTAQTRYHGERKIITDSLGTDSFVLNDETRGGGIETRNMRTFTKLDSSVSFIDDDNFWDHDNAEMDNAATDVHWGSELTYDYFLKTHNRNSFDGKGTKILSYLHHNKNWFNASWNGKYARYGDGNGNPLTSIDVVAHELTHGVTGNSAKLIYRNESGALNESFSDIFGTAVEFYAIPEDADWQIGRANFYLREMGNTKRFSHPNCYGGVFWYTGTGDNGGVHINSGVQNYWFYLLSNGGSGTNDLGNTYSVDSIGLEKAAQIAYRNLAYYLTPSSTFADARSGSVQAAKDIFGSCSDEVAQVVAAWYAVGVGSKEQSVDIGLKAISGYENSCELKNEWVEIDYTFREAPCDSVLKAGETIDFYYQLNQEPPVKETLTITKDMDLFETRTFRFKEKADFSAINRYDVKAWLHYSKDFINNNDSSETSTVTNRANPRKEDVIGFEPVNYDTEKLLFSLESRPFSRVEIVIPARKDGIRGLGFTGEPGIRISEFVPPKTEDDIFKTYTDNIAKMCMCVDARPWSDVSLSFDLRQTYSAFYHDHIENYEPRKLTSLRVTANGVQIDTVFHPDTTTSDPWAHVVMNLDHLAGKSFELCFEGQHFISRTSIGSENVGDNSYLDNINISYTNLVEATAGYSVSLNPNPVDTYLTITSYEAEDGQVDLSFYNSLGQMVLEKTVLLEYGRNTKQFDVSVLSNGLYIIKATHHGETRSQKIMVY